MEATIVFYPPKSRPPVSKGDSIWVLKSRGKKSQASSRLFSAGTVISDSLETDGESLHRVRYPGGSEYNVKLRNIFPIVNNSIVVCSETCHYRRFARTHCCKDGDVVLEIGCDRGVFTAIDKLYAYLTCVNIH